MSNDFVSFDKARKRVVEALRGADIPVDRLYLVRNMFGKVRISVSDRFEEDEARREALQGLALRIGDAAGAHGHPPNHTGVLFVPDDLLRKLDGRAEAITGIDRVYWAERLVTGRDWWTVGEPRPEGSAQRWTLYSVKGGVGRSTTAAVLARHLARKDEQVLVVDLDLESPGLSSAMLDEGEKPDFGVVDWFVEDLVGQGERVVEDMIATPAWAQDLRGAVAVAPAHGRDPGEYLAKLGRVYMDGKGDPWTARLERMLSRLEANFLPTVVLLESRSGLHDIAAATVTDLGADVLLFATDSESNWTDYEILLDHWRDRGLATKIRERLSIVSALTPEPMAKSYVPQFRRRAWDLFREALYDELAPSASPSDGFSFDLDDESAPHDPVAIYWTLGLAAGASLRDLDWKTVELAYSAFLERFDRLFLERFDRLVDTDSHEEAQ